MTVSFEYNAEGLKVTLQVEAEVDDGAVYLNGATVQESGQFVSPNQLKYIFLNEDDQINEVSLHKRLCWEAMERV